MTDFTTLTVRTVNAQMLDETLAQLPGPPAQVVEGSFDGSQCQVRVYGDPGWIRFAITNQGYGTIVDG